MTLIQNLHKNTKLFNNVTLLRGLDFSFKIIDAARVGTQMEKAFKFSLENKSLYKNKEEQYLNIVAPYLFSYQRNSEFADWLIQEGWGKSWGIYIKSNANFEKLNSHFRRFLKVQTEDGKKLYFRFYDPRVLRIFLPTCDAGQLKEFFGPVEQFYMEDEDPNFALTFSLVNGKLQIQKSPVDFKEIAERKLQEKLNQEEEEQNVNSFDMFQNSDNNKQAEVNKVEEKKPEENQPAPAKTPSFFSDWKF